MPGEFYRELRRDSYIFSIFLITSTKVGKLAKITIKGFQPFRHYGDGTASHRNCGVNINHVYRPHRNHNSHRIRTF